eukprot:CAMPEP_0172444600 /NCGR_PEP_ID=MMETSP1065-20121228/4611_1 /TAXON_ID=265537 /ORGANISM="Amphiprora paludosa, Strain CCMP125" /LENGTH=620 /DNA_ID=CAMNT_0013195189 /DNA_START=1422 /DNA_END=3282 /DNA_ORIENTATION=+
MAALTPPASNAMAKLLVVVTIMAMSFGSGQATTIECARNNIRRLEQNESPWLHHKTLCSMVEYKLILHVNLNSHVQMLATPVLTKPDGSAESALVPGCQSMVLQDTIMLNNDQVRGKEVFAVDSQTEVDMMIQEGLDLPRMETGTYKWHHIANAFELARAGQPGGYDILRNCCASFVVDMMSYSGAPADVNALVNYFVERWVHQGKGELLAQNQDYLADLIPQSSLLRSFMGNVISDETLVSMIVKYYVWEYYDPNKAQIVPGQETESSFGKSGSDPMEYFMSQLRKGVDSKYAMAKNEVQKQGLEESYLHQDFSSLQQDQKDPSGSTKTVYEKASWDPSSPRFLLDASQNQEELTCGELEVYYQDNAEKQLEDGRFLDAMALKETCGNMSVVASLGIDGENHFCILANPTHDVEGMDPLYEGCETVRFALNDPTIKEVRRSETLPVGNIFPIGTFELGDLLEAYEMVDTSSSTTSFDVVSNNCVNIVLQMFCHLDIEMTAEMKAFTVDVMTQQDSTSTEELSRLLQESPVAQESAILSSGNTTLSIPALVDDVVNNFEGCSTKEVASSASTIGSQSILFVLSSFLFSSVLMILFSSSSSLAESLFFFLTNIYLDTPTFE